MSATIRINPMAGADVKATAEQAVSVADKLGIMIEYDFNGVTCMARPGDCPDSLAEDYHRALNNGIKFKVASANRKRPVSDSPAYHVRFRWAHGGIVPQRTWYVVPDYRPNGDPATSATVVDRAGQQVAQFESIADAEAAVAAVNGRE